MIKILHVEDDQDIREITQLSLALSPDIELIQCVTSEEALDATANLVPDLFLLDVMMPGMSGPELLAELRSRPHLRQVPAVFMTARVQRNEIQAFLEQGAMDVIAKPFDPVTLAERVMAMAEKGRSLKEQDKKSAS